MKILEIGLYITFWKPTGTCLPHQTVLTAVLLISTYTPKTSSTSCYAPAVKLKILHTSFLHVINFIMLDRYLLQQYHIFLSPLSICYFLVMMTYHQIKTRTFSKQFMELYSRLNVSKKTDSHYQPTLCAMIFILFQSTTTIIISKMLPFLLNTSNTSLMASYTIRTRYT